ncbi:DUF4019 domain-containing protein [Erythrobacter sp. JK5]|uniref:helix-turn-helix domain-containing protein n=1 Tax=Erythrobacter sp. JK5 TaxID=2829500 RepID=UPI001BA86213|nr:DUF4019 domain-containing protein [Erythrobacter sp. JK5]QUL37132.1 DUF4019 domain-containing protein [Erythrobacter sp. JK5]
MSRAIEQLTEKEKETLRLIVRGHDAKSSASHLGLSVHTINERLRAARRKLDVTSSREAARMLFERETHTPENSAYDDLGDAGRATEGDASSTRKASRSGAPGQVPRWALWIGGLSIMSILAALVVVSSLFGEGLAPEPADPHSVTTPAVAEADAARESAARTWLALVDVGNWQASFDAAGKSFRDLNTVAGWIAASEQARVPLGTVEKREAIAFEYANAPPRGFHIVRFRSDFEHRAGVIETITLEREDSGLKVVGYLID